MIKVILRPLSINDSEKIVRWRNLPSVKTYLYSQEELTLEQHVRYFEKEIVSGKCSQFIIVLDENSINTDIGTIFIKNIDRVNHNGELGIFIGEEFARGKGYAQLALEQILNHAFYFLGLHKIYLTVMSDNISAIKSYENVGFIEEGILRENYFRNNEYIDIIMMSILKQEWEERPCV